MKSLLKAVSVSGLLLVMPSLALAAPGIPHQFYGTVSYESGTTPDGLVVEAKVNGTVVGSSITKSGKYGYMPDLLFASKTDGEWSGETATFFVGGIDTGESFTLAKGGYTNLNLTVPGSVGTITKSEGEVITATPVTITSTSPTIISVGDTLDVTISSDSSVNATIDKVEKLTSGFFTGSTAILSGQDLLNAYEIKVTGTGLAISVSMTYSDTGIDESTIKPYRWSGSAWVAITPFTRDTVANTITFSISSAATPYVLFGTPVAVAPQTTTTSGGGGGGGGGGSITTTTTAVTTSTATTLTVEQKAYDTNSDNRIDVLDFNALIVHWGEKGTAVVADFDKNGSVDVFDFNALMVHWTA